MVQVAFWVRFDQLPKRSQTATLFALGSDADGSGVALSVDSGGGLSLRVGDTAAIAKGGRPTVCRCGGVVAGRWHFVAVTHMRPRSTLSLFSKDSLSVSIDLQQTLLAAVAVPRVVAEPLDCAGLGLGLDGELGEVVLLKEHLSDAQLALLAAHSRTSDPTAPSADLDPVRALGMPLTGSKSLASHLLAAYHPQRTARRRGAGGRPRTVRLDLHGGCVISFTMAL